MLHIIYARATPVALSISARPARVHHLMILHFCQVANAIRWPGEGVVLARADLGRPLLKSSSTPKIAKITLESAIFWGEIGAVFFSFPLPFLFI